MGDKSNWKNKNRKFLRESIWLPEKLTKKIGEVDIKKETEKFAKESVWINKLKKKLKGNK